MIIDPRVILISKSDIISTINILKYELAEVEERIDEYVNSNVLNSLFSGTGDFSLYAYIYSLNDLRKRRKKLVSTIKSFMWILMVKDVVSKCKYLSYYRRLISRIGLDKLTFVDVATLIIGIIQIILQWKSNVKRTPRFAIS